MGSLTYVEDPEVFLYCSLLAQFLGGIGGGINMSAIMALLSGLGPDERERAIGINEAGLDLGMLTGPLIGAGLYDQGGYQMPFYTFGKCYLHN